LKAVLLKRSPDGALKARVSEIPVPAIGRGEVLVEMKACGLCGTDIEKLRGEYTSAMPIIGHEAVGTVSVVGAGVEGLKEGDRVLPHHHVPCYQCYYCRRGDETVCSEYKTSNLDPGGFSEFIRVPAWNVSKGGMLRLPKHMEFEEGALIEPLACCVRAPEKCGARAGDSALVVGAGPAGMMNALLLRSMKAKVVVSDVAESRLQFAKAASVGSVLNAEREDVPGAVREETGGRGADLAIVASGSERAVVQALRSVRKGGIVCLFGIPVGGSAIDYDLSRIYDSTMTITASYGAVESDVARAAGIISNSRPEFRQLITHRFALEEFDKGVEAMVKGQGMKVVITP